MQSSRKPRLELITFDLDGTILHGRILYYLRVPKALHDEIVAQDELFFQGKLGYKETIGMQLGLLVGMKVKEIAPDPDALPLVRDLGPTVHKLRESGVRVAILTDNPSFAADPLRVYGFQDIIASKIETSNGVLTDRMRVLTNKLEGLSDLCKQNGFGLSTCAHVGDWVNDIVVFERVGLSVAFNPTEEDVARAATWNVRSESLLDVYEALAPSLTDS